MQVFKGKLFRRIFSLITLVAVFIVSYAFVTEKLSNTTYRTYFEHDIDEILKNGESVDLVFVGASRMYQSMVPSILEEKLGYENVLVGSTATQPICGTYYYMKELIETVHPKEFIIDVTWDRLLNEIAPQPCLLIYDRLSVKNRIPFVLDCFETSDWKYLLGPCRFRDNILLLNDIETEKRAIKEKNYDMYDSENDYYAEKGFVYSYKSFETGTIPFVYGLVYAYSDEDILYENVEYLNKCINLCKDNGIKVSLVTAPCSLNYMYFVEGYDDAVEWYKAYAKEQGISYYNLNYLRDRETILCDERMLDNCHTNGEGAKVTSEIYADILLKERNGEDVSDYFYKNFDELKADVHRAVAVSADIKFLSSGETDSVDVEVLTDSLQNDGIIPFYQIELISNDGETKVLSEWSQVTKYDLKLPGYTGYSLLVRAKTGIEGDLEAYQRYDF